MKKVLIVIKCVKCGPQNFTSSWSFEFDCNQINYLIIIIILYKVGDRKYTPISKSSAENHLNQLGYV